MYALYFRHDGCLLPFARHIESMPVIWMGNPDEELYTFECTAVALPIHNGGFWSRLSTSFAGKSMFSNAKSNYLIPALRLVTKSLPNVNVDLDHLYSDVRLALWGADTVLRSNFASLTQSLVEVGRIYRLGNVSSKLDNDIKKKSLNTAPRLVAITAEVHNLYLETCKSHWLNIDWVL